MKLPGINYDRPVPQLGKPDPSIHAATALAAAKAASDIAGVAGQIYEGVEKEKANKALLDSYNNLNEFDRESRTSPATPDIEKRYDDKVSEIRTNVREHLGTFAYKQFESRFSVKSAEVKNRVSLNNALRINREQREAAKESIYSTAFGGDLESANEYIDNSIIHSEAERVELRQLAGESYAAGRVERATYSGDVAIIKEELDDLRSDDYNGPLEGKNRRAAISQLTKAHELADSEREARVKHERERFAGDLEVRVSKGESGPVEINRAFDSKDSDGNNMITGPKRTQLLRLWDAVQKSKVKKSKDVERFSIAMYGDERLDPKNKDDQLLVDEQFLLDPTPEYGAKIAEKTNIMPKAMESNIRRFAMVGNPNMAMKYANVIERLEQTNPGTLDGIGIREIAVLKAAAAMNRANVPLDEAIEVARENAKKTEKEKELLRNELKTLDKDIDTPTERFTKRLNGSKFDTFGPQAYPTPTPAVKASYAALEEQYYLYTGDVDMAGDMAFSHLERIIGATKVNGKNQLMAWAPTSKFQLPDNFIKDDLDKFAEKNGIKAGRMQIYSDQFTPRDNSYKVYELDEFGNPSPTNLRWTIDPKEYSIKILADAKAKWQELEDQRKAEDGQYWTGIGGV